MFVSDFEVMVEELMLILLLFWYKFSGKNLEDMFDNSGWLEYDFD